MIKVRLGIPPQPLTRFTLTGQTQPFKVADRGANSPSHTTLGLVMHGRCGRPDPMRQLLPGIKTYDAKSCVADPILYIASKFRPYGSDCFRCHDAAALCCVARRRGIPHRRRAAAPTW